MARSRIRVLAEQQDPHLLQRQLEGPQDPRTGGQEAPTALDLGPQSVTELTDERLEGAQRRQPGVVHEFVEGTACHGRSA